LRHSNLTPLPRSNSTIHKTFLFCLCTHHLLHFAHSMEFCLTPFLHTAQGNFPKLSFSTRPLPLTRTFVFAMVTFYGFASIHSFIILSCLCSSYNSLQSTRNHLIEATRIVNFSLHLTQHFDYIIITRIADWELNPDAL